MVFGVGDGHQSNPKGLMTLRGSTRECVCQDKRRNTAVKRGSADKRGFYPCCSGFSFSFFFLFCGGATQIFKEIHCGFRLEGRS